jgi:hypothetical protein
MQFVFIFLLLPLGLFGALSCLWLAIRPFSRAPRAVVLCGIFIFWLAAVGMMTVECGDWVHLFWMSRDPIVAIFVLSGALLFTVWPEDAASRAEHAHRGWERLIARRGGPATWFFAMLASLGALPIFLIELFVAPDGRNIGAPFRRVFELAAWGFGGALPECLNPITIEDKLRGVGHLPREVTVPTGTLMIAAYLWVAFCLLAIIGGAIADARVRRVFLILSPLLVGFYLMVEARVAAKPMAWFDVNLFLGDSGSGVWESDPTVLKSFGPVLLAAGLSAIVLAIFLRKASRGTRMR